MLALRAACHENQADPRLWTLYAAQCVELRRCDEAAQALRQALWLRKRLHDAARAQVTRALLERLDVSGRLTDVPPRAA